MKLILTVFLLCLCQSAYADFNSGDTFGKGLIVQLNGNTLSGGGRTLNFASGVSVVNGKYYINITGGVSSVPVGSTIWVDAINGNDSTCALGRLDLPCATFNKAYTLAGSGDLIQIGPGTFTLGSSDYQLASGESINCAGQGLTTLSSTATGGLITSHVVINPSGNNTISNCTLTFPNGDISHYLYPIGWNTNASPPDVEGNNVTLLNDTITNFSDGLYFRLASSETDSVPITWTVQNVTFNTNYDDINAIGGGTDTWDFTLNLNGNTYNSNWIGVTDNHVFRAVSASPNTSGITYNIYGGVMNLSGNGTASINDLVAGTYSNGGAKIYVGGVTMNLSNQSGNNAYLTPYYASGSGSVIYYGTNYYATPSFLTPQQASSGLVQPWPLLDNGPMTIGTYLIGTNAVLSIVGNVGINASGNINDSLDVGGPAAIGPSYAGTQIPPSNGLIVQGNVGIGTYLTNGALSVGNGFTAGRTYASLPPPTDGALFQGNVGIGSTVPGQKLDVQGTARMTGFVMSTTPTTGYILTASNSSGTGVWSPASTTGTNYWNYSSSGNIGVSTSTAVGIGTTFIGGAGEAKLAILGGNVGVGTWAPVASLGIQGSPSQASDFFDIYNSSGVEIFGITPSNGIFLNTNGGGNGGEAIKADSGNSFGPGLINISGGQDGGAQDGGAGGNVYTYGGAGGSGGSGGAGGTGGNINTYGGAGSAGGGNGGNGLVITGNGGAAGSTTGNGGNSGAITVNGGSGNGSNNGGNGAGLTSHGGNANSGGIGGNAGTINANGGNAGTGAAGGNAGAFTTNGGNGSTSAGGTGGTGGTLNMSGAVGSGSTAGANGGSITTSASGANAGGAITTAGGGSAAGGSITMNNGGGSINTTGNGSIQLGVAATQTTLNGSGSVATDTLPGTTTTLAGLAVKENFTALQTFGANVGIGTTAPTGALEIEGGNVGIGTWTIPDGGTNNIVAWGNIGIGTTKIGGTNEGSLVVMSGNVGIGSVTPGALLDVQGTIRGISGGTCTTLYRCVGGADAGVIQTSACVLCPGGTCSAMNGCF